MKHLHIFRGFLIFLVVSIGFMQDSAEIVIVDDQKAFRDALSSILKIYNINVIACAENGNQLFEILNTRRPDVILLDIEMPEMDGSETLNQLRDRFPCLKTIVVSQYDEMILIQDFLNRGACAYLSKNTDVNIIAKAIHSVKKLGFYRENLIPLEEKKASYNKRTYYKIIYSKREREIIHLICKGKQVSDIAALLNLAEKTVEANMTEIYKKAKVKNRSEFLIYAIQEGLNYLGTI